MKQIPELENEIFELRDLLDVNLPEDGLTTGRWLSTDGVDSKISPREIHQEMSASETLTCHRKFAKPQTWIQRFAPFLAPSCGQHTSNG